MTGDEGTNFEREHVQYCSSLPETQLQKALSVFIRVWSEPQGVEHYSITPDVY